MKNAHDEIAKLSPEERALLEKLMKEEGVDISHLPISRVSRKGDIPLSYSQERLWSLWSLAPDNPSENVFVAFEVTGKINIASLEKATNEIIKRNEILRTICVQKDDGVYQQIHSELKIKVEEYDFSEFDESERKPEAKKFIEREISLPFDLTKLPIFRLLILKLDKNNSIITIITHQFISDGYTANLLLQSLADYYNELSTGNKIPEEQDKFDYVDFASWHKKRIEGNYGEKQLKYWKEKVKLMPSYLQLPAKQDAGFSESSKASSKSFSLPADVSNGIRSYSEKNGYSVFMILLVGLQLTLHKLTGQQKIIVTTSVSTRGTSETENMFGNFSNNILFCSDFKNDHVIKEILNYTRTEVGGAFEYQDLPLEYLQTQSQKESSSVVVPKIQVLFMLRDKNADDLFKLDGLQIKKFPVDFQYSKLDLLFDIFTAKEEISINLTYKKDLFDIELLEEFFQVYKNVLKTVVNKPSDVINSLPEFKNVKKYTQSKSKSDVEKSEYISPRTDTEKKIAEVWEKYFRRKNIGVKDNYFALGGHSMMALAIFNDMEKVLGKKLPLATLFKAQTIEKLAAIISNDKLAPDWSSIVPVNDKGNKIPFFCIHGAGGNVLLYKDLSQRLGDDQPFYGIQSKGLDGSGNYHTKIEEMASYYIDEMLKIQPNGPYLLGGYCMGGTIAYEMAHQLIKKGHKIGLVALLDTYNFNLTSRKETLLGDLSYYFQNTIFHLKNLMKVPMKEKIIFIREKIKVARERTGEKLYHIRKSSYKNSNGGEKAPVKSLQKLNDEATLTYVPKPFSGNVVVFKPEAMFTNFNDPTLGWGNLVKGDLKVIELPVYPKGMLVEPFVATLADKLRNEIASVRN